MIDPHLSNGCAMTTNLDKLQALIDHAKSTTEPTESSDMLIYFLAQPLKDVVVAAVASVKNDAEWYAYELGDQPSPENDKLFYDRLCQSLAALDKRIGKVCK